jgi:hypothetical protein
MSEREKFGSRALYEGLSVAAAGVQDYIENKADLEKEQNDRMDNMRAVKAKGAAQLAATKRVADLDPLSPDFEETVYQTYLEEAQIASEGAQFADGKNADVFKTEQQSLAEGARVKAFQFKQERVIEDALMTRENLENELLNRVREDPAGFQSHMDTFEDDVLKVDALLPPNVAKARSEALQDNVIYSRAEGLAEAGDVNSALEFLDSAEAGGVDPAKIREAKRRIRRIESTNRTEFNRATANQVAELTHRVMTGQAGYAEIDAAEKAGLFQAREGYGWQLKTAAANVQKSAAKEGRKLETSAAKLAGGFAEQEDVDRIYNYELEKLGPDATPEQKVQVALDLARQTYLVPDPLRDAITTASRSANPEKVAQAADLHAKLVEVNPYADTGATDTTKLLAEMTASGADPVETAKSLIDSSRNRNSEARAKELREARKSATKDDTIGAIREANKGLSEDDIANNPDLILDVEKLADTYFKAGNITYEDARAHAAATIGRQHGRSEVLGGERSQPLPPEQVLYSTFTGKGLYELEDVREYLNKSIMEEVGAVAKPWAPPGADPSEPVDGRPAYILHTDNRTRDAAKTKGPLSYEIRVRTEFGYSPILTDDEDEPRLRYYLPSNEQLGAGLGLTEKREKQKQKVRDTRAEPMKHWTPGFGG